MSKKAQMILDESLSKTEINWDLAISEAEKQIKTAKEKIKELKKAISYFGELKEKGSLFVETAAET